MKRTLCLFAAVAGLLVSGALQAADFAFNFANAPVSLSGLNDEVVTFNVDATLTTTNNTETYGAQGWSLSVAAENCTITVVSVKGCTVQTLPFDYPEDDPDVGTVTSVALNNNPAGFKSNALATSVAPLPLGISGAVSAIVLNQTGFQPLLPNGTETVAKFTVTAKIPASGILDCATARLYFLNGMKGTGQPVANVATFQGNSNPPTLGQVSVNLCPPVPVVPRFNLAVVTSPGGVPAANGDTTVAKDVTIPEGQTETEALVETEVLLSSENFTDLAGGGGQGWSLSVAAQDCEITVVSVKGCVVQTLPFNYPEDDPDVGVVNSVALNANPAGFKSNALAVSVAPLPLGISGAVSAIVLNQTGFQPLVANTTQTVLKLTCKVTVKLNETTNSKLYFLSGLKGPGQPVSNVITYKGQSEQASKQQGLVLNLTGKETPPLPLKSEFERGDANDDGIQNIADAVNIVYNVVPGLQGDPTQYVKILCPDSGDANADGQMNLGDAIFLIDWQFRGGPAPAAPFGVCGTTNTSTDVTCPPASTSCP